MRAQVELLRGFLSVVLSLGICVPLPTSIVQLPSC